MDIYTLSAIAITIVIMFLLVWFFGIFLTMSTNPYDNDEHQQEVVARTQQALNDAMQCDDCPDQAAIDLRIQAAIEKFNS